MNKAIVVWQKILDRHVSALKSSVEMSAVELKAHLKAIIELAALRWAMFTPASSQPTLADRALFDLLHVKSDFVPSKLKSTPPPRQGGKGSPWWDRKDRYDSFYTHALAIILRAADKHRYRKRLGVNSSIMDLLKAVVEMTNHKVSWKKMPAVGGKKRFAASLQFILDPKVDLEQADKHPNGLSNLLAQLEKALGLI